MAQAEYVSNAVSALTTGANAKPPTSPVRAAHADLMAALAKQAPWPIPLFADASDIEDRADHLKTVLDAVATYVTTILDDSAQNVPRRLELRHVDALFSDLRSEVTGTLRRAADDLAESAVS